MVVEPSRGLVSPPFAAPRSALCISSIPLPDASRRSTQNRRLGDASPRWRTLSQPAVAPQDESASAASGDDGCVGWGGLGVGGAASSRWDSSSPEPRRPSPWNHEDAFELSVSALDTRLGVGGAGFEKLASGSEGLRLA